MRESDKEGKIFRRYFLPGDSRVSQLRVARPDFPFIKVARLRPLNNTSLLRFPKFVGPTNTTHKRMRAHI